MNIEFTATMEEELDEIAKTKKTGSMWLEIFISPWRKTWNKPRSRLKGSNLAMRITDEKCPKCGKPMAIKSGRFGKFLACTGYPECKSTKPFQIKTGAKCPECGKELVQRMSKRTQAFLRLQRLS